MGIFDTIKWVAIAAIVGVIAYGIYWFTTNDFDSLGDSITNFLEEIGGGLTGAVASIWSGKKYGIGTNAKKIWSHYFG